MVIEKKEKFIIKEHSIFRLFWDVFLTLLSVLSIVCIPISLGFPYVKASYHNIIFYSIDFIFILNILLNFRTSFMSCGVEILDTDVISKNYLKKNFWFDLLGNLPFELIFIFFFESSFEIISNFYFFRVLRIFRMLTIFNILNRWRRAINLKRNFVKIFKFIIFIVSFLHIIACTWFAIFFYSGLPNNSWGTIANIKDLVWQDQYIRSLYWAITTLTTIGFGDITPQNNLEYIFTMLVMLFGASLFAYSIGVVSSLISSMNFHYNKYWENVDQYKSFLVEKKVPISTSRKINAYYEYIWDKHRGIPKQQSLFSELSKPLKVELLNSIIGDCLKDLMFFKESSKNLKNELILSLDTSAITPDMLICQEGEPGKDIYIISEGHVDVYFQGELYDSLERGDVFGLLPVLFNEKTTASIRSKTYLEIFSLSKADYERIKKDYPEFIQILKKMSQEKKSKTTDYIRDGVII